MYYVCVSDLTAKISSLGIPQVVLQFVSITPILYFQSNFFLFFTRYGISQTNVYATSSKAIVNLLNQSTSRQMAGS